jgi:hypothetical protein
MPPKRIKKAPEDTKVIGSSRFKTIRVPERTSIRAFVEKNKLEFAPGKGFYQLNKPETIQFHKEVVVRRKSDGVFVTGDEVCVQIYVIHNSRSYISLISAQGSCFRTWNLKYYIVKTAVTETENPLENVHM